MFETIITSLLKRYVTRYVDINIDQLSAQFLCKQQIIIENLTLNTATLNEDIRTTLKLPIKVESFHIGNIQCSFAWSSLFFRSSSPVFIVKVEHVRAVIKPIVIDENENESSQETSNEDDVLKKRNQLDFVEQQLEKEFEYFGKVKSSRWGVERLLVSFLEKVHLEVVDVHISYESSTPDKIPYTIGLTADNVQMSNEPAGGNIHRQVFRILGLAFYADTNNPSIHSYILLPSRSTEIYLAHRQQVHYELECSLNELKMQCSVDQVRALVDIARFVQDSGLHHMLITDPSRPRSKISPQSAKAWWRYATLVIIRTQTYLKESVTDSNPSRSTTHFWFDRALLRHRLRRLVTYKRAYRAYLDNKYLRTSHFSSLDNLTMNEIEMEFDMECLLIVRRAIFRTRANEHLNPLKNQERSADNETAGSWYINYAKWITSKMVNLWGKTPVSEDNDTISSTAMANVQLNENEKKLQDQVNTFIAQSLEDEDVLERRHNALVLRLKLVLKSMQINLLSSSVDILFDFCLNNVTIAGEFRPHQRAILVSLRLEDMSLHDQGRKDAFSTIVCSRERSLQDSSIDTQRVPVFELLFEKNPRSKSVKRLSFSIAIRSGGLCIVCCPASIERLHHFYASAFDQSFQLSSSILYQWKKMKNQTVKLVKTAWEHIFSTVKTNRNKMISSYPKHIRRETKHFAVYLDVCAPKIIIPLPSHRALIADLGWLVLMNDESKKLSYVPNNCCDVDLRDDTRSPLSFTEFVQQRSHSFTEQQTSSHTSTGITEVVSRGHEDEFLTPDSSPPATDGLIEAETTNYPVNVISTDRTENQIMYSSFSLFIRDTQLGYETYSNGKATANKFSEIVEKFNVSFFIQHRIQHSMDLQWPLIKVSGTLPKILVHLDSQKIETLGGGWNHWIPFVDQLIPFQIPTFADKQQSLSDQSNVWLDLAFRLDEISIHLNDNSRVLCEIDVQKIDLLSITDTHSHTLTVGIHSLTIVDIIQQYGQEYRFLLKSNRTPTIDRQMDVLDESMGYQESNDYFIRVYVRLATSPQASEHSLTVDINVNRLDLVFNPETFCALVNFFLYPMNNQPHESPIVNPFLRIQSLFEKITCWRTRISSKINSTFQEFSILLLLFNEKHQLEKVGTVRVRNVSLEVSTEVRVEIAAVQIFDLLCDREKLANISMTCREQSNVILDIGTDLISPSKALCLLLTSTIDNSTHLSIKVGSVCYFHSPVFIDTNEKIIEYMIRYCHLTERQELEHKKHLVLKQIVLMLNRFVLSTEAYQQLILSIDLDTSMLIFRPQTSMISNKHPIAFHVDHMRIENAQDQSLNYKVQIDRVNLCSIDLEHEIQPWNRCSLTHLHKHLLTPCLCLNLQVNDGLTTMDSKVISPFQVFLGPHQIRLLQQILSSLTYFDQGIVTTCVDGAMSLFPFAFRCQLSELIVVVHTDDNVASTKVCEVILDQCQMSIERRDPSLKMIALRLDSLRIQNHSTNVDKCFLSTRQSPFLELTITVIDKCHERFDRLNLLADVKIGEIDIEFDTSAWTMLLNIAGLIDAGTHGPTTTEIYECKILGICLGRDPMKISIHVDVISCFLRDDKIVPIEISLRHINCQVQTNSPPSTMTTSKFLIINGQLGSISIRNRSRIDQSYDERLCTTGTNALVFSFMTEQDPMAMSNAQFSFRHQFQLRMTAVQYIHKQRFFFDLIEFFDRHVYHRIRSLFKNSTKFDLNKQWNDLLLDIELESLIVIFPEHAHKTSAIIFHLGHIHLKKRFLYTNTSSVRIHQSKNVEYLVDVISIEIKDIQLYSTLHYSRFSHSALIPLGDDFSAIVRERFYFNIEIQRQLDGMCNRTLPTCTIKANLSPIDILLDATQHRLIQNIIGYNTSEQSSPSDMIIINLFNDLVTITHLVLVIDIDHVGLEIFMFDVDVLLTGHRRSLGYAGLVKLHISFDHHSNGNRRLDLTCSVMKLIDTRIQHENIIVSSIALCNQPQLEIHLLGDRCILTLNHVRFLVFLDWLLELNPFLNSIAPQITLLSGVLSTCSIRSLDIQLNLNRFELVLVRTAHNQHANALVLRSTMVINYRKAIRHRPLECSMTDLMIFSCQWDNMDETTVCIVEPMGLTLDVHTSNEMPLLVEQETQTCEVNLPMINIRLSHSDIKMIFDMFESMSKQISQAKSRYPFPNYFVTFITLPLKRIFVNTSDRNDSPRDGLFNIELIKLTCDQICLCLIDDCLCASIPLLNINLKSFLLQTIENNDLYHLQHGEFQLNIDYYNRLLSGFEPLIEWCPLQMTFDISSLLTSILICSKQVLNLNFTKTMYHLYGTIKNNWFADYYSSNNQVGTMLLKEKSFSRRRQPLDSYCFKNFVGVRIRFCTWLTAEKCFASHEHIVEDNQTISFNFSTESLLSNTIAKQSLESVAATATSTLISFSQSDRRLLISIDGWEWLQPISIDRVGTFFRLAVPSNSNRFQKPVLVLIEIAMADSSMRSITVRSPIEIQNQLLSPIDMRLECDSGFLQDFRFEANEVRSLPIQFCSTLKQIQVRPADFALDFCDEPVNWTEIASENGLIEKRDDSSLGKKLPLDSIDRQSFFRTCSIDGKEAVYYVCLQSKRTRLFVHQDHVLFAYQLSIVAPLTICNLLPCTLTFQILPHSQRFQLNAYKSHREETLNTIQGIDILFATELYHMNKPLHVPPVNDLIRTKYHHQRVIFYDNIQRTLLVNVIIECINKHRLKISLYVPYVLLNKTGIPLIFKDASSKTEAAGQSQEHELAPNREPLVFSFDDPKANNTCVVRVGTGLHGHQHGRPQWSQRFSLEHGSRNRQLHVRSSHGSPDWIYLIGIDVRPGNGRLRKTNFIFLSARYMISNQCSYDLSITQRHIARAMLTTDGDPHCLHVLKHSTVAYHWPRSDIDQFLCVRVIDDCQHRQINWSGGFPIDCVNTFHINMRYENGQCLILPVQVIERSGTYFVVIMDSNHMPAPLRICNRSDVLIQFYQTETREESAYLRAFVQPQQSIDYAWDEPTLKPSITCSIVDGTKETYDLLKLGYGENLHYENYIYLALQATFDDEDSLMTFNTTGSSRRQLVIDYVQGRLVLAQRQEYKRSQWWHMTSSGLLIHVGATALRHSSKRRKSVDITQQMFVLDIEDSGDSALSNLMTRFTRLTVKPYDPKRLSTQTWRFLDRSYLCMGNTQMCVQVFGELDENNDLVLGLLTENDIRSIPPLMYICPHQYSKGSGVLSVRITADGPTRVLEISHSKTGDSSDKKSSESLATTTDGPSRSIVYHIDLRLEAGVGVSVIGSIGHESEELIYVFVNNIHVEYKNDTNEQSIGATIGTITISNQLLTATTPCFLYSTYAEEATTQSAVRLQANLQKHSANYTRLHIVRSLRLDVNSITILVDEILLWKLIDFFDIEFTSLFSLLMTTTVIRDDSDLNQTFNLNQNDYDTQRLLSLLTSTRAIRIYFNELHFSPIDLNLSVYCVRSKRLLPPHLLAVKKRAPFPLVPFESAQIHLKAFEQVHIFNTYDFFLHAMTTHYVDTFKRQALKILGSADFLGNPVGLFHDVTDGLSSLVDQGSVTGLVKNVAHGVADSTSKVTGSISHGLGKLVSDNERDHRRQSITSNYRGSPVDHVIGGTKDLAAGFYGGLTSMIKQPYKGAVEDGMGGLVKGFARGIVGTVSKPVVGILDFTSGMAMALKESSRSPNAILCNRIRPTRCPTNLLGLLQPYSVFDAYGHCLLYQMNKGNVTERYITRLILSQTPVNTSSKRPSPANTNSNEHASDRRDGCVHAMVTSQRVIVYRTDDAHDEFHFQIINNYDFSTLTTVVPIEDDRRCPHVQFLLRSQTQNLSSGKTNAPHYSVHRCDTLEQASILAREVQRTQEIFEEEKLTYVATDDENDDDYDETTDDQQNE